MGQVSVLWVPVYFSCGRIVSKASFGGGLVVSVLEEIFSIRYSSFTAHLLPTSSFLSGTVFVEFFNLISFSDHM